MSIWQKIMKLFGTVKAKKTDEEKRRKKALILWFTLPFSFLLVGGGTVGIIAGTTDLFSPRAASKIDIETIFHDSTKWNDNVSGIVTTATGAGYVYNNTSSGVRNVIDSDIIMWLKNDAIFSSTPHDANADVINDISFTIGSHSDSTWLGVTISAQAKSRKYEGSFVFYVYIQNSPQGTLSSDFTATAIDLSGVSGKYSVTDVELFEAIKAQSGNTNLNTNAIKLQWNSTGSTWADWSWNSTTKFGIGTNAAQTNSLICWDTTNEVYKKIRIAPGGSNQNYYYNQTPIEFTLKLYRDELKNMTGWKQTPWVSTFNVSPTLNSFYTRFDTLYDGETWYANKLDGEYLNSWDFTIGQSSQGAIFNIKGNPFYNSYTSTDFTTADSSYVFGWQLASPVNVSTVMVAAGSTPIADLNNVFYQTPIVADVITAFQNRIDTNILPTISWNQITITITSSGSSGTISLQGSTGSLLYNANVYSISYTLRA